MKFTFPLIRRLCVTAVLSVTALVVSTVNGQSAPYDLEKFHSVLDDSKLQAPKSSPTMIKRGDFAQASNEYFFLDKTGQFMTFTVDGDSCRSELRQSTGDWDTATTIPQRLIARVRVFEPEDEGLNEFTFLQIHDKKRDSKGDRKSEKKNNASGLNKPLIRIVRCGDYRNTHDHLWARIRTPKNFDKPIALSNLATKSIDLGPRPEGFFDAEIKVQNSQMIVTINGQTKVEMDVSYWDGLDNYFKAGVYNQDPGRSKVEFDSLRFSDSNSDSSSSSSSDSSSDSDR